MENAIFKLIMWYIFGIAVSFLAVGLAAAFDYYLGYNIQTIKINRISDAYFYIEQAENYKIYDRAMEHFNDGRYDDAKNLFWSPTTGSYRYNIIPLILLLGNFRQLRFGLNPSDVHMAFRINADCMSPSCSHIFDVRPTVYVPLPISIMSLCQYSTIIRQSRYV